MYRQFGGPLNATALLGYKRFQSRQTQLILVSKVANLFGTCGRCPGAVSLSLDRGRATTGTLALLWGILRLGNMSQVLVFGPGVCLYVILCVCSPDIFIFTFVYRTS